MSDAAVDVVVLGGGPGGYTAAFRAADLGLSTVLVEREPALGGVCLHVGCIPSKALLHAASLITGAEEARSMGIDFGAPRIDLEALRDATGRVVGTLARGLDGLARKRRIRVVRGDGRFASPTTLTVAGDGGDETIGFRHAIIAAGSRPIALPSLPDDPRIVDSTGALALESIPERMLIVGGGIIGLELAAVYDALGSRITIVEMQDALMPGCDPDLVAPLKARIASRYEAIRLGTTVDGIDAGPEDLQVRLRDASGAFSVAADRVLVAVGRRANGDRIGAAAAGVALDEHGAVVVDADLRTSVGHILAIGDIAGEPMLAHKASHQGRAAAEIIAGAAGAGYDARAIPSVAYTDPEIAWAGLTETRAAAEGVAFEVAAVPWAASGRALTLGRGDGRTKLLVDPATRRILGGGIVGPNAGELIAEIVLAIEMGATAEDIALTVHPHPTLSETVALAAQWAEGTITDLSRPPRRADG